MNYLLDTCVISEVVKNNPNLNVINWLEKSPEDHLFLSVLTIGEIQKGISKLSDNNRKFFLQNWLQEDLLNRFTNRIIDIDFEIVTQWGALQGKAEAKGIQIPTIDGLIGATAVVHNLTIITRNVSDFEKTGAKIINLWL